MKKKVGIAVLLVIVPITAFFTLFIFFAIAQVNEQLAASGQSMLEVFQTALERQIRTVEDYLKVDMFPADFTNNYMEENIEKIIDSQERLLDDCQDMSCIVMYASEQGSWVESYGAEFSYGKSGKENIREAIKSMLKDGKEINLGWHIVSAGESQFLSRIVSDGGYYGIAFFGFEQMASYAQINYGLSGTIVFLKGNETYSNSQWLTKNKLKIGNLTKEGGYTSSQDRYIKSWNQICGVSIYMLEQYSWNQGYLGLLRLGPVLFFGCTILAVMLMWIYLNRSILNPLKLLMGTMEQIQRGKLDSRLRIHAAAEFVKVNDTFNDMMDTIAKLKIEAYEQRIEEEQSRMQMLRLQINPHFYLNCLTTIYSMAEHGKVKDIKSSVLLLSDHLRYIFTIDSISVALVNEIKMCEKYMELQAVGKDRVPICRMKLEAKLSDLQIPPVSLLSLVENSMKYGQSTDKVLEVIIQVYTLNTEEGAFAYICVKDNGNGFSKEYMKDMGKNGLKGGAVHIGIANMIQRFYMMFGERFMYNLLNHNGAIVELYIPLKGDTDETVNSG